MAKAPRLSPKDDPTSSGLTSESWTIDFASYSRRLDETSSTIAAYQMTNLCSTSTGPPWYLTTQTAGRGPLCRSQNKSISSSSRSQDIARIAQPEEDKKHSPLPDPRRPYYSSGARPLARGTSGYRGTRHPRTKPRVGPR